MNSITSVTKQLGVLVTILVFHTAVSSQSVRYGNIKAVANIDSLEKSLTPNQPKTYLLQLLSLEKSRSLVGHPDYGKNLPELDSLANVTRMRQAVLPSYQLLAGQMLLANRDHVAALKNYQAALGGFKSRSDTMGVLAVLNKLAELHLIKTNVELRNVELGVSYAKEATALAEQYGDKKQLLTSLSAQLAALNYRPSKEALVEVEKLSNQMLVLIGNDPQLQVFRFDIANSKAIHYSVAGKSQQAYATFRALLEIPSIQEMSSKYISVLLNTAFLGIDLKKYDEALGLLNQVLARSSGENNKLFRVAAFNALKEMYARQGNYQQAFAFADSTFRLQTEIYKTENTKQLNELEATYRNKEITSQNTALVKENELVKSRNTAVLFGLIVAGVLTLSLTVVLIFLYRSRKATQLQIAEVKRLSQVRDQYVDIIAHDLRSPILAMQGMYDVVSASLKSKRYDEVERISAYIDAASLKTRTLLDNLFNWGLTQRETVPYYPEKLDVVEEIREVSSIYTAVKVGHYFELRVSCPDNLTVMADRDGFRLILRNLLDNAVKHLPAKNGRVEVTAEMLDSATAEIRIQDNGSGISKEKLDQINYVFTHPEKVQLGFEGLGLGTILVGRFVRKNKGKVLAKTNEPTGSSFTLLLPIS